MKVALVGLGHIGGSLAKALSGCDVEICCYDSNQDTVEAAMSSGLSCAHSISDVILEADLILLSVPTASILSVLDEILHRLSTRRTLGHRVVISDVSSTKSHFIDQAYDRVGNALYKGLEVEYLSLHPMAGKEGSGFDSSSGELLEASTWAVLLERDSSPHAVSLVMEVIGYLGGRGLFIDRIAHDRAVALISHIPHLVSFAYTQLVQSSDIKDLSLPLRAGSFRDLTRVAKTDPEKVAAMVVPNRGNLVPLIDDLIDIFGKVRSSIDTKDQFMEFASPLTASLVANDSDLGAPEKRTLTIHGDNLIPALMQISKEGGLVDSIVADLDQDLFEISFSVN